MKKLVRTALAFSFALVLLNACSKRETPLRSPDNRVLASSETALRNLLQEILSETDPGERFKDITAIRYYGSPSNTIAVVSFTTNAATDREIAIQQTYDTQNVLLKEIAMECKGSCGAQKCHLEGIIDPNNHDNDYVQCSCTNCKMAVVVTARSPKAATKAMDIEALAKTSYAETFNRYPSDIMITKTTFGTSALADYTLYEYADAKGNGSSFMLLRTKTAGVVANGETLAAGKTVEIDCTGTCDCRERFIPSTSAVECTCSPCKMKVTTISTE
jgi:hypothetical protein